MSAENIKACLVIIGNEILSGRTQDTNLKYLACLLEEWGIRLSEVRVLPDIEDAIVAALNQLRPNYDYVFTTGGLGPTHDDITAECIAKALNLDLVVHPEIVRIIENWPIDSETKAANIKMAKIPQGATLVDNPTGGSPGFQVQNVIAMAGVPVVFQAMLAGLEGKVVCGPKIRSLSFTLPVRESQISFAIREIQDRFPAVEIGSYPFFDDTSFGTSLVLRSTHSIELDLAFEAVKGLAKCSGLPHDEK